MDLRVSKSPVERAIAATLLLTLSGLVSAQTVSFGYPDARDQGIAADTIEALGLPQMPGNIRLLFQAKNVKTGDVIYFYLADNTGIAKPVGMIQVTEDYNNFGGPWKTMARLVFSCFWSMTMIGPILPPMRKQIVILNWSLKGGLKRQPDVHPMASRSAGKNRHAGRRGGHKPASNSLGRHLLVWKCFYEHGRYLNRFPSMGTESKLD